MKRILILLSISAISALNASSSDLNPGSSGKCKVTMNGRTTKIKHSHCDKLPKSKNYPVRGY
jgi:hypothetical protein